MKVYEVYSSDYDAYNVHGIFSTRKRAQAFVDERFEKIDDTPYWTIVSYEDGTKRGMDEVVIREWEVDHA